MGSTVTGWKNNHNTIETEILNRTLNIEWYESIDELIIHLKSLFDKLNINNITLWDRNIWIDEIINNINHFVVKYNELFDSSNLELNWDIYQNFNTIQESILWRMLTRNYWIRQAVIMTILNRTNNWTKKYISSENKNQKVFSSVLSRIKNIFN